MQSFWIEWADREPASLEAQDEAHALVLAEELTGSKPIRARTLYYRSLPALTDGRWPPYCTQPALCAGWAFCTRTPCCDS